MSSSALNQKIESKLGFQGTFRRNKRNIIHSPVNALLKIGNYFTLRQMTCPLGIGPVTMLEEDREKGGFEYPEETTYQRESQAS